MTQKIIRRQRGKRHQRRQGGGLYIRRRRRNYNQKGGIAPLLAAGLGAFALPMLKSFGIG